MERPDAAELLEIARATLLEEIVPGLSGDARFKALMIANAMAIAGRAVAPMAEPADTIGLCRDIRGGLHDDDAGLAARLRAEVEMRCRISSKPNTSP